MTAPQMALSPEAVAKIWSRLDWDNIQIKLSEEVKAIGVRQDEAEDGKKRLLDESSAFRQNTNKDLRKAALPLIKAFQAEVDRLTLRSKAAESVVIDVCRSLTHVPDPSQFLEQIESLLLKAQRLQTCEEELGQLKSQIADLHSEYADLQNQDLTVRKLREQIKNLESEAENNVQAALSETEKQLRSEFDNLKQKMNEEQEQIIAENKKLVSSLTDMEIKNRDINRSYEEVKLKLEQKGAMEDEQMEIISKDLENAIRRAEDAEREVAHLREEINRLSGGSTSPQDSNVRDSALLHSKDNQIRKLLEENKELSAKLTELSTETRLRIDELTQELERHAELVDRLESQLRSQADYEDIKKELRILRSVEFGEELNWNGNDGPDNGVTSSATATAEVHLGGRLKALDELLVEKNRKLQGENVALRMRNQELEGSLVAMERSRDELAAETERQRGLISRLESDLLSLHAAVPRPQADGAESEEIELREGSSTLEMLSRELNNDDTHSHKRNPSNSIFTIVTSQRDRLRLRVEELEKEKIIQKENIALLQSEIDRAREDNVQLYGKIKFLQSYQNKKPHHAAVRVDSGEAEIRYQDEYEQHLDPFRKFNMQEKQRKYAQLRAHDKAALSLGRWMMSSSQSRAIFFFYLLFLHLLVFLVLYRFAYNESCNRDFHADCIANFQKHMHQFHPGEAHPKI